MIELFQSHPWVVIVLAAFAIPLFGIVLGFWTSFLENAARMRALRVIERFAEQGKDPPAELVAAVTRRGRHHHGRGAPPGAAEAQGGPAATMPEAAREEWRENMRRWRRGGPLRAWRRAILLGGVAGGLYAGSLFATLAETRHGLLIAAAIVGCVAAAMLLSALIHTLFRDR